MTVTSVVAIKKKKHTWILTLFVVLRANKNITPKVSHCIISHVLTGENPCFNKKIHVLLSCFHNKHSRAVLKSDVKLKNVQSSEPKSVASNVTLSMPWKWRNQNTCRERAFFAEIQSPNIRIFQRIFF